MIHSSQPRGVSALDLARRIQSGDVRSLAYAISLVENDWPGTTDLLDALESEHSPVVVVGFTGPPGSGKSTLISAYVAVLRRRSCRVGVVGVDPSSPLTGGAILGDRLRMHQHVTDPGVFIRSVAARGHLGGLCRNIVPIVSVIKGARWDAILLETVGTGQSEVEIARVADVKIVINTPAFGDAIQAMKAGVVEVADILVVNKADMPGADGAVHDLEAMLKLRPTFRQSIPIVRTIATNCGGVDQLSNAIDKQIKSRPNLGL